MNTDSLTQELLEQIRIVLATALDGAVDPTPATPEGAVWSVPITLPTSVSASAGMFSATKWARPKSRTLTCPCGVSMRLWGLTSRWTMPRSKACCKPIAAWRA